MLDLSKLQQLPLLLHILVGKNDVLKLIKKKKYSVACFNLVLDMHVVWLVIMTLMAMSSVGHG